MYHIVGSNRIVSLVTVVLQHLQTSSFINTTSRRLVHQQQSMLIYMKLLITTITKKQGAAT